MDIIPDTYRGVEPGEPVELRVKGSRFVGHVFPVENEERLFVQLHAIRKSAFDATHHCWAARLGSPLGQHERTDDDGEPSGTAGRPILGALQRHDVHGALIVVTRWYGGTKLGTGGLARAYGDAAELAMQVAPRPLLWLQRRVSVRSSYDDLGLVEAELARRGSLIRAVERNFEAQPRFEILVPRSESSALQSALVESSAGRLRIDIEDVPAPTTA